jgi:hypothetical protein
MGERPPEMLVPAAGERAGFAVAIARSGALGQGARDAGNLGMPLGPPSRRKEPLNVITMALALALAAFLGAALGLIWHASGFGDSDEAAARASQAATK